MIVVREGEMVDVGMMISRARGSGAWALVTEQYRILDGGHALVTGYDWAAATWDAAASELYALFDSTIAVLSQPGVYYMQLRGVIGVERYEFEVPISLREVGP